MLYITSILPTPLQTIHHFCSQHKGCNANNIQPQQTVWETSFTSLRLYVNKFVSYFH